MLTNCQDCQYRNIYRHHFRDIGCAVNPGYWSMWKCLYPNFPDIAGDAIQDCQEFLHNQEITLGYPPKIVVTDILDEVKPLLQKFPATKIVVVGISQTQQRQALEDGAIAVCLEGSTNEQVGLAIRAALEDTLLVSPFRRILVLPFPHRQAKIPQIIASLGAKLINDWRHHDSVQATEIELVEQLSLFDADFESSVILELEKHFDSFRLRFVIEKLTSIDFRRWSLSNA